ncbi:hypothetical protein ACHAXM_003999 [Skeletonema potamos]
MIIPLQNSKYRSARAVPAPAAPGGQSALSVVKAIRIFMAVSAVVFLLTTLTTMKHFHDVDSSLTNHVNNAPVIKTILTDEKQQPKNQIEMSHYGVHANVKNHIQVLKDHLIQQTKSKEAKSKETNKQKPTPGMRQKAESKENSEIQLTSKTKVKPKENSEIKIHSSNKQNLARGHSGLPMDQTPALIGAKRGSIQCDSDADVSSLAYWNDPQGTRDEAFVSPFRVPSSSGKSKYLTFEPDFGGFNNIRMSFENIIVMAAATGRVLVLPPSQYIYLLQNRDNFDHFFPLFSEGFQKRVKVITMKQFLEEQFAKGGYYESEDNNQKQNLLSIVNSCETMRCDPKSVFEYIRNKSYVSELKDTKNCLVFDTTVFTSGSSATTSPSTQQAITRFCGEREPLYYDAKMAAPDIIHFHTGSTELRILNHFYTVMYFTNPAENNYYKRFIRDFIHYRDEMFCAAGKIINLIQEEGKQLGFKVDDEGAGGFSALHIRRGDLQFKEVIISAEEWYENTRKLWQPNEILYIATDEKNRKFFEPIAKHHQLRFLDDYLDKAGLANIEKQYLGMLETIIASRGRLFVGTWHSTFSAYIMRLRGYYGVSKMSNYYAYRPRRFEMIKFRYPYGNYAARDWQTAWLGIDGEKEIVEDLEPNSISPIGPFLNITSLKDPKPRPNHLARGMFGLPMSKTPALEGGSRGTIECDVNVDSLAYWNDPQGTLDKSFSSPFRPSGQRKKYITFWQDPGRFNNCRMSLEIIFVIAAATGRAVVLPPNQNLRLERGSNKALGFETFYSFSSAQFRRNVEVITMPEFIEREGGENGVAKINKDDLARLQQLTGYCENRRRSDIYCGEVFDKLLRNADMMVAPFSAFKDCLIFDVDTYKDINAEANDATRQLVKQFCGTRRPVFYTQKLESPDVLHFETFERDHRLLAHFYSFILFTAPAIDNHFKRFVRDFMHFNDKIFCVAGKIVRLIQQEALERGFQIDEEGGGGYTSLHVRRDDLQYKDAVLSDDRWWNNTKEIYKEKEILYIATDEKDKKFFDHFADAHDLRFLDDYWDVLDLGSLDKELLGMVDAIVASRGRAFVGTYYSTFSGYIMRMRGYHGMSKLMNWYSWNPKKFEMQTGKFYVPDYSFEREYAVGWVDIDGDVTVTADKDYLNPTLYVKAEQERIAPAHLKNATKSEEFKHQQAPNAPVSPEHGNEREVTENETRIGFSTEEDKKLESATDGTKMYVIFSTDCSPYQQWQSYLFFFSAFRVRQPGIITRIASGCTEEQKKTTEDWHNNHIAVVSNRFKIIFTPKFSHIDEDTETGDYKFFNKPFGTKYFIENSIDFGWDESSGKLTKAKDNEVILILDPDMLLLQPLTTDFSDSNVKFWKPFHKDVLERKKKVAPGAMFGQTYGLGNKWKQFESLAGPNSPARDVDERNAQLLYQVGPPYIGVASDMYRVVNRWAELVRAVHKEKPQLLAEMYAYQLAAADQELPHGVVDSMMISAVNTYGEAWDYIDALPNEDVCGIGASPDPIRYPLPTLLHYCQTYGIAKVLFEKRSIPQNVFSCQSPLLKEPPTDPMSSQNSYIMDMRGNRQDLDIKHQKRHVFASCAITSAMNEAALFFKLHHCGKSEANTEKKISLIKSIN